MAAETQMKLADFLRNPHHYLQELSPFINLSAVMFCIALNRLNKTAASLSHALWTTKSPFKDRWKARKPLCYSTCINGSLKRNYGISISAGGWSAQPSLCARQRCNFTLGSTCCSCTKISLLCVYVSTA